MKIELKLSILQLTFILGLHGAFEISIMNFRSHSKESAGQLKIFSVVTYLAGVGSIHVILGQPVRYFIFDVHRASTCGFPPTRAQDTRTLIEPVCVTTSLWQPAPISEPSGL